MGCILFELATDAKAFKDDYATQVYTELDLKALQLDEYFDDQDKESITKNVALMLHADYTLRPSATDLLAEFSQNFQVIQKAAPFKTLSLISNLPDTQGEGLKIYPSSLKL